MQQQSIARVQVTIVASRGEVIHVYGGQLQRSDAIAKAKIEYPYEEGAVFIVLWREVDLTQSRKMAEDIHTAVKQMKKMIFK